MADLLIEINDSIIDTIIASRGVYAPPEQLVQEALALLYWATSSTAKGHQIVSVTHDFKLVERVVLIHETKVDLTPEERRAKFRLVVPRKDETGVDAQ